MMLTGQISDENVDEVLSGRVEEIRGERRRKLGADGVLVIEGWGDVEAVIEEPTRDFGEFLICFDPIDEDAIKERYRHVVTTLIASLCIASPENHKMQRVAEGIYLIDESGKVIHPRFPRVGGGTVFASRRVEQQTVEATREYSTVLANTLALERVSNLFVQSMDLEYDDFRRFVFGWIALEIFIGKVFRQYEGVFVEEIVSNGRVHGASRHLDRVREVMNDRYRLVDKFSVIAAVLASESSDADVDTFKRIKDIRDDLFHRRDVPEMPLPNAELQELFSKYFRRHLDYMSCA